MQLCETMMSIRVDIKSRPCHPKDIEICSRAGQRIYNRKGLTTTMFNYKAHLLVLWTFSVLIQHCTLHRVSKNLCTIVFVRTSSNFHQFFIIFGTIMAKRLKLCEMHPFSTSTNSCHHTIVWNTNVPNCYTTLKVVICYNILLIIIYYNIGIYWTKMWFI